MISHFDTSGALKVAHCTDPACAGGDTGIAVVDDPANSVGGFSSIAIGADGLPVISYLDGTAGDLKVAHCNDVACAGGDEMISVVDDPANPVGLYTSIAIGADGFPIISYQEVGANNLRVAHCNDVACTGGGETITVVDDGANVGWYTSIAIGADGLPVISYLDAGNQALKVAHCNDVACSASDETITTVDDTAAVGWYTSIAIGSDGLPVISYQNDDASALRVAHCNDVACTGGDETITDVDDPAESVGEHTSIAIGAGGFPVISYLGGSPGTLKLARCNDVACAGGDEAITTVDDPTNNVGEFTSTALGADGAIVISYRDVSDNDLKVAHISGV